MSFRKDTFLGVLLYLGAAALCSLVVVSWLQGGLRLGAFVYVLNGVIFPAGMFAEGYSIRLSTFFIAGLVGPFTPILFHHSQAYRQALYGARRPR